MVVIEFDKIKKRGGPEWPLCKIQKCHEPVMEQIWASLWIVALTEHCLSEGMIIGEVTCGPCNFHTRKGGEDFCWKATFHGCMIYLFTNQIIVCNGVSNFWNHSVNVNWCKKNVRLACSFFVISWIRIWSNMIHFMYARSCVHLYQNIKSVKKTGWQYDYFFCLTNNSIAAVFNSADSMNLQSYLVLGSFILMLASCYLVHHGYIMRPSSRCTMGWMR